MTEPASEQKVSLSKRLYAFLRVLQWAMLAMSCFYVGLGELLRKKAIVDVTAIFAALCAVALGDALIVIYVCLRKVSRSEDLLRNDAEDRAALMEVRKWCVVAMALSVAVILNGFVLRIMGSQFWQAFVFYAAGIGLVIYCRPQQPE